MADLFISYSRKDKEFVRKLHDALAAQKRDIWVDWEDIPLASDWRSEIFTGIEGADSFLFVISPDSAASEVCGEEVSHAADCKKRMIPVYFRDGDYKNIHPSISSHNWIYCRPTDDFDTAVKSLADTLDTDLDYVKTHTRLLVRAKEWDSEKRNPSYSLRGADLQEAEQWLISSADKKPAPTLLHNEYINASRQAAAARQRVTIGALAFGLVIAIVLALFAVRQSQLAQQNAVIAQQNADIAQANFVQAERQRLGSLAQNVLNSNGNSAAELAALLAVRSLKMGYSQPAELGLSHGLRMLYPSLQLVGHTDVVTGVAIAPSERYVVTGSADKTVRLWDTSTGKEIRQYIGHTDTVTGVAVMVDGPTTYIFSSSEDGTVREWDLQKGTEVGQLVGHSGPVTSVHVTQMMVVTTGADKTVRVWNGHDRTQFAVLNGHEDVVTCADVSPGGKFVASGSEDGTVRVWDVTTGQTVSVSKTGAPVESVALNKDLSGFYFGNNDNSYSTDTLDLLPPDAVPGVTTATHGGGGSKAGGGTVGQSSSNSIVALMADGRTLLVSAGSPDVADDGGLLKYALFGHTDSITSIATTQNYIVTGSYDKTALVWSIRPGDGLRSWHGNYKLSADARYLITHADNGYWVLTDTTTGEMLSAGSLSSEPRAFGPDNKSIISIVDRAFEIRDIKTGDLIRSIPLPDDPAGNGEVASTYEDWSPDGKIIAVQASDSSTLLLDALTGKVLYQFPSSTQLFSPDGKFLITNSPDTPHLINLRTLQDVSALLPKEYTNARYSADGTLLAYIQVREGHQTTAGDNTVILLDSATGQEVRRFTGIGLDFAFSPDGKMMLDFGTSSQPMRLLDIQTGGVVRSFQVIPQYQTGAYTADFSADSKLILTDGRDLEVWDVTTGDKVRQFAVDGQVVFADILADDRSVVVMNFADGVNTTMLLPIDFHERITYACSRLKADLTDEERREYGITDTEPTCPQTAPATPSAAQ